MYIAVIADVHVGNHSLFGGEKIAGLNSRCRSCIDALERALDLAVDEMVDMVIVAGDLFDTDRPDPRIVARVAHAFTSRNLMEDTIFIVGNHDQASPVEGDHALGVFKLLGARVVQGFEKVDGIGCVGFNSSKHVVDLIKTNPGVRIWISHIGIEDSDTPPWLRGGGVPVDEALAALPSGGVLLSGDWHAHDSWINEDRDKLVMQIGALVPTGFDNPSRLVDEDPYGSVVILNTEDPLDCEARTIDGPRFLITEDVECAYDFSKKGGFVKIITDDPRSLPVEQLHANTIVQKQTNEQKRAAYSGDSASEAVASWVDTNIATEEERRRVLHDAKRFGF